MLLQRREFLCCAGAVTCGALLSAAKGRAARDRVAADLAAKLATWRKETYVMGAGVAAIRRNEPLWRGSVGLMNRATNTAVDDATVFQAASLSKPVFAYAVLTLAAEGKFDLDKPLLQYSSSAFRSRHQVMASEVPEDPRLKRITPRRVLSHTTGFPNWGRGKPLAFLADPGAKFGYSGEGYVYLQNVIEHVTGESLAEFAHKRVFTPLGMTSSSFIWRDDYETRAAIGYNRRGPEGKWKPREPLSAGTLHTTAGDYASFLGAMLAPLPGARGELNGEWLTRMLTRHSRIDDSLGWGLGWGLERSDAGTCFWQWGDDGEFKAFAMGNREKQQAVVVLTNSANGLNLCRRVVEQMLPGPHPALSFGMLDY